MRAGTPPASSGAPRLAALADLKAPAASPGNGHHDHGAPAARPLGVAPSLADHAPPAAAGAAASEDAPRRWSTLWPLIVAVIAICAIIASVAMLVFGDEGNKTTQKARRFEGPAPELTPTDPAPHQVQPPGAMGVVPSMPAPSMPPPSVPSMPAPSLPAPPVPAPPAAPSALRDVEDFLRQAVDVGCRRMTMCLGSDPTVASYCAMATPMLRQMVDTLRPMCPDFDANAGRACIDSIGRLPCPASGSDPTAMAQTLLGLGDCQQVCAAAFRGLGFGPDDPDGF